MSGLKNFLRKKKSPFDKKKTVFPRGNCRPTKMLFKVRVDKAKKVLQKKFLFAQKKFFFPPTTKQKRNFFTWNFNELFFSFYFQVSLIRIFCCCCCLCIFQLFFTGVNIPAILLFLLLQSSIDADSCNKYVFSLDSSFWRRKIDKFLRASNTGRGWRGGKKNCAGWNRTQLLVVRRDLAEKSLINGTFPTRFSFLTFCFRPTTNVGDIQRPLHALPGRTPTLASRMTKIPALVLYSTHISPSIPRLAPTASIL